MDYIAQFRVMNPHLFKPATNARLLCCNFENLYETLNQRHIPKRGQTNKTLLRSMFLNISVLNTLNIFTDLKGRKENIICTMDDVRGDFLRPPHCTTPAAVIANKI